MVRGLHLTNWINWWSSASMAQGKTAVTPLLTHWSYCSIALRRIYTISEISVRASKSELGCNQNKWIDVSCLHCPRFCLGRPVSELVATCSNFLGHGRPEFNQNCAMRMFKAACSRGCCCRLPKWPWPRMTSDRSLGCSVNRTLSGTRARMLGQCKCKCALKPSK